MYDRYHRRIHYLRISVTDRCNMRCRYCMPEEGVKFFRREEILSFEEIQKVVEVAASLGIDKVRLTGGEPLVRKDIVELVRMIAQTRGVLDLGLTTNGLLLNEFAAALKSVGLKRVNISLDTLDPDKFFQITRGGNLAKVLEGISEAKKVHLNPIKINCVIREHTQEPDALQVAGFCKAHGLQVRYIKQMNLQNGQFGVVYGGSGGDCTRCNRLRLTSNGMVKPCLFSNSEFSIREYGIKEAIFMALEAKPEKGACNHANCFHNIGG